MSRSVLLRRSLATAAVAVLWPAVARACTVCDSSTAQQVRAGIFDGQFVRTLFAVVLPFPVFALAVGLLHYRMPELEAEGEEDGTALDGRQS